MSDDRSEQRKRLNAELARIVGEAFVAGISLATEIPLRFGPEEGERFATRMAMVKLLLFYDDQGSNDFLSIECPPFDADDADEDLALTVGPRLWPDGVTRITARQEEVHRGDGAESHWLALTHPPHGEAGR